ncbi:MAG: hypothetical protein OXG62_03645 [Nitrospinae bacterium]|nr:hypothetical protein [Nitrospinota bacterium]
MRRKGKDAQGNHVKEEGNELGWPRHHHSQFFRCAARKLVGARREESQGASNSFNKRRVYPRLLNETGQTRLEWRESQLVTGRAYTLFWDW